MSADPVCFAAFYGDGKVRLCLEKTTGNNELQPANVKKRYEEMKIESKEKPKPRGNGPTVYKVTIDGITYEITIP